MTKLEALKVCEAIKKYLCAGNPIWNTEYIGAALDEAMQALREQKAGEWHVLDECSNAGMYCSNCGKKVYKLDFSGTMKWKDFKYCPHCGARIMTEVRL